MSAADYPIVVEQGATFDRTFTIRNSDGSYKDLTGYSARAMIREGYSSAAPLLSLTSPSSAGEGLDVGTTNGQIRMRIKAATTAALTFYLAKWDLEIVAPTGEVYRVLNGDALLSREVTK